VYVVWSSEHLGRCEVLLAHSDDGGKSWSSPSVVNDDRPPREIGNHSRQSKQPVIAVNSKGVVGVSWYEVLDTPQGKRYQTRFSASLDGGESFLPSIFASSEPYRENGNREWFIDAYVNYRRSQGGQPLRTDIGPDDYYFGGAGDTRDMLVGPGGSFHPFWYDNRTGVMQLYTAAVTVSGTVSRNGDPLLDGLVDVTDSVGLRYVSSSHDPARNQIVSNVVLVNRSSKAIHGPVRMRAIRLSSLAADIRVAGETLGTRGQPIWDFTSTIENGVLGPHAESQPLRLEFELDAIDSLRIGFPMITMTTRVFAAPADRRQTRKRNGSGTARNHLKPTSHQPRVAEFGHERERLPPLPCRSGHGETRPSSE
jgi:hypothetical protein